MIRVVIVFVFVPLISSCLLAGAAPESPETSRCATVFEGRVADVLTRRGVARTSTYFPSGEAWQQQHLYPGEVCAEHALVVAVHALLVSDAPESLREVSAAHDSGCGARCFLNRSSSMLGIVADGNSALAHRLLPMPPGIDTVAAHWVFFLSVPDLGEHGYWALVPRNGRKVRVIGRN